MPEPEVITRELLEKWVRDAETGEVYSVTSEGRLLRLCGALLAGVTPSDALRQFDGSPHWLDTHGDCTHCGEHEPVEGSTCPDHIDGGES